jgi:hypothetical protein
VDVTVPEPILPSHSFRGRYGRKHWATGGESMWAAPVGPNEYELRNTPFYAYDLNWGDVVLAVADAPNQKPRIRMVVRRSGHSTLRLFFRKHLSYERGLELLGTLQAQVPGVSYEGLNEFYFALDLLPETSVDDVRDILDEWMAKDWIEYETAEARASGSFDDAPKDDTGSGPS